MPSRAPQPGQVQRWAQCQKYLRRAGSLPGARSLAAADGFSCNTSVWITALGKVLKPETVKECEICDATGPAAQVRDTVRGCFCIRCDADLNR